MRYLPLIGFLLICVAMGISLAEKRPAGEFTSKLIGKQVEPFTLSPLSGKESYTVPQPGKVTVVNVFASWCTACIAEHAALTAAKDMPIIGIAWKDKPEKIQAWLAERGDPYRQVLLDEKGQSTLPLALSGVPETFVFDKRGVVRYNRKAAVDAEEIENVILPLVERLRDE